MMSSLEFLAGVGVHLHVFDAVAGGPIDLIEADLLGIGGGRIQSNRTGNKGEAQKALPIGARGHGILQTLQNSNLRRSCLIGSDIQVWGAPQRQHYS
jgi:hypothetical protein